MKRFDAPHVLRMLIFPAMLLMNGFNDLRGGGHFFGAPDCTLDVLPALLLCKF
jgi:hypothetical protein